MLKIAITGNIASGKSLFEKFLINQGFEVLCLDLVTKKLYEQEHLKNFLLEKFNTFDKKEVSKIVFSNKKLKSELENFIFPLIKAEMDKFFSQNEDKNFVFVSAAILFESGFDKYFDKKVLIISPLEKRIERLMKRDGFSPADALLRINSQADEEEKIPLADFVVENSGSVEEFKAKTLDFIKNLANFL